ncbi:MAG: DUF1080 domain-containing protein [Planctomycetes bacterium]|nr:DUF1080 domain-containing protein [Planctomycetota bacterium]
MLLTLLLSLGAASGSDDYTVPEGFAVETVGESVRSYLAATFDSQGRLFVSVERGPIAWLADTAHDGKFAATGTFEASVESAQGLAWLGDDLWVVGERDGATGLFRLAANADHTAAREVSLVVPIAGANGDEAPGEHGVHGVVVGPDGALYVSVGNHAKFATSPSATSPLLAGYEGTLLPPYYDPLGHALHVRYPCGYVARVDPRDGSWRYVCVGLRNAYDLAFDANGELFTFDSDMEWDVGLPWYRPVRFLHVVDGADFGSRTGSYPWPSWYEDSLPPIAENGRGSPTGVVVYESELFPARYRGAVLAGDWSQGRILALHPTRAGGSFTGEVETLVQAKAGLNVTDLAIGPDGALYFVGGGRGVLGRIERLTYRGPSKSTPATTARAATATAVRELDRASALDDDVAWKAIDHAAHAEDAELRARAAFWSGRRAALESGSKFLEHLGPLLADREAAVRAEALRAVGLARAADDKARAAIDRALTDADRHVRFAARFAWERAVAPNVSGAPTSDPILWARRWLADRRTAIGGERAKTDAEARDASYLLPYELPKTPEAWIGVLRSIEIALEELGAHAKLQGTGVDWDASLLAAFPHADSRVSTLLASVLAARDVEGAREALLAELGTEPRREQQIHYARCLVECVRGWTHDDARRLFAWFDVADGWSGGASFGGYLEAMRSRFASRFDDAERLALAREAPLGGRTLAHFAREVAPESVEALVPALKYAWVQVAEGRDEEATKRERAAILRALRSTRSKELASWLRKLVDEPLAPRDEVRRALAEQRAEEDWPVLVDALASESADTVEACVAALTSFERKPSDSRAFVRLLSAARRLGSGRGPKSLALFERWTGERLVANAETDWNGALAGAERSFRARFPDVPLEGGSGELGPRLEVDALVAFLDRSAARPGSTARGKALFERASCATCHVVEGTTFSGQSLGTGPELATVGRRFDRRALVEAVLLPSRAIAELYRTTIVVTVDEERLEGRVVRDDARGLELVFADGSRRDVARADVSETRPSTVSLMPEGLLAPFDFEDAKDLFAFLAAGRVEPGADDAPFQSLFAGKARSQWGGDRAVWLLDGDLLVGTGSRLARSSYLASHTTWRDFEVAFDVRLSEGANSGLQLRSRVEPDAVDPIGLQADLGQRYWGSLYATDGRGALAAADERWREVVDPTGWNHVFVRCVGERYTVELNGLTTVDIHDGASDRGVLAFQVHEGPAMEVRVTHAKIRELPAR